MSTVELKTCNHCTCKKCGSDFVFMDDECTWDENGYGYSTKIAKCDNCGCINAVDIIEDYAMTHLNDDEKIYF